MILTIALIVLLSSIAAFFSQEFARLVKRIFDIPGAKLILPLIAASFILEVYEDWGHWFLIWLQAAMHQLVYQLASLAPFKTGSIHLARMLFLFVLASVPMWFFHLKAIKKRSYHPHTFAYYAGLLLWIIGSILLTVSI